MADGTICPDGKSALKQGFMEESSLHREEPFWNLMKIAVTMKNRKSDTGGTGGRFVCIPHGT